MNLRSWIIAGGCLLSANVFAAEAFKGSDTLMTVMQAAIKKAGLESSLTYAGSGSSEGEKAIVSKAQGMAPMSRAMKPEKIKEAEAAGIGVTEHVVALDGVGIFVNKQQAVASLSLADLKGIYSCTITAWSQIDDSLLGAIKVYARDEASGTTELVKKALGITQFGPCVIIAATQDAITTATSTKLEAIGYAGLNAKVEMNELVPVSVDEASAPVEPTVENIRAATYPLSRKLYVYKASTIATFPGQNSLMEKIADRAFLDPIIEENGFITVD